MSEGHVGSWAHTPFGMLEDIVLPPAPDGQDVHVRLPRVRAKGDAGVEIPGRGRARTAGRERETGEIRASSLDEAARYKLPKAPFFSEELPRPGYGQTTKKVAREALGVRGCLSPGCVPASA